MKQITRSLLDRLVVLPHQVKEKWKRHVDGLSTMQILYRANFDGEVLPLKQRELSSSLRRGTSFTPFVYGLGR